MRFSTRLALIVCMALSAGIGLTGCGAQDDTAGLEATDADARVLAEVNGFPITSTWFQQTYVDFLVRSGSNDTRTNRFAHLDNLIDSILLAEEYEREGLADSPDFERFAERVRREELGARFFETALLDTMQAPTEADVRRAFVRWNSQAVVRHLYFTSPEEAERSWQRLEEGTTFLEEAQRVYGLPEPDSMAGYLGPIRYFGVDDAFAETAWSLEAGEYSRPVRTRYGYHIILLEDMLRKPLLTESEYQTRRGGMSSQYRLRRRRLEGDRFIRSFMEARNVDVNGPAIQALSSLIEDLDRPSDAPVQGLAPAEQSGVDIDSLRAALDEDVVLASYEWDGERVPFTAGDYAFWFEGLPMREARERTGASIGRALRNDALARAGEDAGLRDAEWRIDVQRRLELEKARRMRQEYRSRPSVIDSTLIRQAFDRLGWQERRRWRVSFDAALFGTVVEARRAAERASTSGRDWPVRMDDMLLDDLPDWNPYVVQAPVDSVVVVARKEDWAVLRVRDRERVPVSWEDNREEIERRLAPFATEYQRVKSLREEATVRVDTTLFNEIAEL